MYLVDQNRFYFYHFRRDLIGAHLQECYLAGLSAQQQKYEPIAAAIMNKSTHPFMVMTSIIETICTMLQTTQNPKSLNLFARSGSFGPSPRVEYLSLMSDRNFSFRKGIATERAAKRALKRHPIKKVKVFSVLKLNGLSITFRTKRCSDQSRTWSCSSSACQGFTFLKFSQYYINTRMDSEPLQQNNSNNEGQSLVNVPEPQKYLQDYTIYLQKTNPFYELLLPAFSKLPNIFELGVGVEPKTPANKVNLRIFTKQHPETNSNIYVYKFAYPGVTWKSYLKAATNAEVQKKLDSNLNDYEIKAQMPENIQLIYLAYKKVLFISPRDFVYVRHHFEAGEQKWIVTVSKPNQEEFMDRVRADIVMTAGRFEEKQEGLHVSVYSHVNMKLKMKPASTKPKGMLEIKKFLQKQYEMLLKAQGSS